jgi:acetyl-CoA carboxylase biotin carboxyl carrier protein
MSGIPVDPAAIRALASILVDTGLTEIEIETKEGGREGRIRVVRAHAPAPTLAAAPMAAPAPTAQVVVAAPPLAGAGEDLSRHPGAVLSPMVGVVYLAPDPGATPFIVPGQAVAAGQTLMLIEAMKTFNQIKAPKAGTVSRILVDSGAPVEYGEPLLILE